MTLRIGYCYVSCVEQIAWIHFSDYTRTVRYFRSAQVSILLLFMGKIWGEDKISLSAVGTKFSWGGFIQWHIVVICIWCAFFVTSQFYVIFMFPKQRFGEVCWPNICIFFHTHSPYFVCYCTKYKLSALQVRISEENTLNATIQQFINAKISGWALKQASKTHSSLRQSIYNCNFCIKSTN